MCVSPGWSIIGPLFGRTEGAFCYEGHGVGGQAALGGSAVGGDVFS